MKDELDIQIEFNTAKAYKILKTAVDTLYLISSRYYYYFHPDITGFYVNAICKPHNRKCSRQDIALDMEDIIKHLKNSKKKNDELACTGIVFVWHIVRGDNLEDFYDAAFLKSLKKHVDPVSQTVVVGAIEEMRKQNNDVEAFCNDIGAKIGQEIDAIIDKYKTAIAEEHAKYIESRTKLRIILLTANEELKKIYSSYRDDDVHFDREFFDVDNSEDEFTSVRVKGRIVDDYFDLT